MRINSSSTQKVEISMSPLIDCVFLLLIFFLVSTMQKKQEKRIDVSLPSSKSAEKLLLDDKQQVITLTSAGSFYFQGLPIGRSSLREKLKSLSEENPYIRIRLDADKQSSIRNVAEILDLLQFLNLKNVGIRTYEERS